MSAGVPSKATRSVCSPASRVTCCIGVSAKVVPPKPSDTPLLSGSAKVASGAPPSFDTVTVLPPIGVLALTERSEVTASATSTVYSPHSPASTKPMSWAAPMSSTSVSVRADWLPFRPGSLF